MTTIRALLARALDGHLYVLTTDDIGLEFDVEGISASDLDLGLLDPKDTPKEPGIYLWTGTSTVENHGTYDCIEPCTVYDGTCRLIEPHELPALLAMSPPACPNCGDGVAEAGTLCPTCAVRPTIVTHDPAGRGHPGGT